MKWHLRSGARSVLRNALYISSATSLTIVLRGLYALVLARHLGPDEYGVLNYGLAWYFVFLPLTFLGLQAILGAEVGRDRGIGKELVSETLALKVAATGLLVPIYVGLVVVVEPDHHMKGVLLLLSMALAGRSIATWVTQVVVAYETARLHLRQEAVFRSAEVILGIIAVLLGAGVYGIAALHGTVWLSQAVFGIALVHRRVEPLRWTWSSAKSLSLLRRGLPIGISTILTTWLMQSPLLVYRHAVGADAALGQLALVLQLVGLSSAVVASGTSAALPVLSRSVRQRDGQDKRYLRAVYAISILLGGSAAIVGALIGEPLIVWAFGQQYQQAAGLIGLALWLLIPLLLAPAVSQYYFAHRKYAGPLFASALGLAVVALFGPSASAGYGVEGVLWAFGAGCAVWGLVLTIGLRSGKS